MPGCGDYAPSQTATVAVVELTKQGAFADPSQLPRALDCLRKRRASNPAGVVVVLFIHGWKHNATWDPATGEGDQHFRSFRNSLVSLAVREDESAFRDVFGIYLGWPGKETESALLNVFTFWNRYGMARDIGSESAILDLTRSVTEATKGDLEAARGFRESSLLMIGHSMGALMLETAFLTILRDDAWVNAPPAAAATSSCQAVYLGERRILFPDTVLLLNTAADAKVARSIKVEAKKRELHKLVSCHPPRKAPVFISAASEADEATRFAFRLGKLSKTSGNTRRLFTHELKLETEGALCSKRLDVPDFGQSWHCLRVPQVVEGRLDSVYIDLPQLGERRRDDCHVRYRLAPLEGRPGDARPAYHPFWLFRTPRELMTEHSDIFNDRAASFVMALTQLSGAALSLARVYDENFSPEEGPCSLPGST